MRKAIMLILIVVVIGVLFWQQNTEKPIVWVQVVGFILLFYGGMRLSRKTPSKHQDNTEE